MGKNQSKFGLSSLAGKKRENPEGGTYVLNGCVNGRFRNSEDCVWSNAATAGSPAHFKLTGPGTPEKLKPCQCENEQSPVGFAEDNCRFEGWNYCEERVDLKYRATDQYRLRLGSSTDPSQLKVSHSRKKAVALPPEVTGSACSVKVYAMEERDSICKPPRSPSNGKLPSGAVDYNVSLDREKDQQEWSFTLYDFDGHRRVTREDLSSVLRSISEALSTTVTLPPCGSKKLHLRLSVMPDKDTKDPEKVHETAIVPPAEGKNACVNETQVVPDLTQTQTKNEQITAAPAAGCTTSPITHVHRRHHHGRKDGATRTSRRHSRSHPTNQGDAGNLDVRNPDKRHSRLRKNQSSHQSAGIKVAEPEATAVGIRHPSSNTTKEASTPETPCTVIVNELTTENLANHDNQERKSDENRERRNYYQELAGIENNCSNREESEVLFTPAFKPAQVLKAKHDSERTKNKHRRSGGHQQGGLPHHRHSKVYDIDIPLDQLDRTARHLDKPKGTTNYHIQLLEASQAKLGNQQPAVPPTPLTPPPLMPEDGGGGNGNSNTVGTVVMHRKEQRRRHHHNTSKSKRPTTLQPFMLFEHELRASHDRQVYVSPALNASPTLHRHDHHHHHEHHHHYHYHHYHT